MKILKTNEVEHIILESRIDYLNLWYSYTERLEYNRYVKKRDTNGLKKMCRCHLSISRFCPACSLRFFRKKYTKK